ncbi:MAG: PAS domain S-box protein [Candidatus Heimdallarchaeota archaeon]
MKAPLKILHLEDNKIDVELVKEILTLEDVNCKITSVDTRSDYINALRDESIDIILADYSLPSFDGLSALKLTREMGLQTPFILVSAVLGEELAIEALQSGATDYVLKSRMERLVPAIQRALREIEASDQRKKLEITITDLEAMHQKLAERVRGFLKMDLPSGKFSLVDIFLEDLSGYTTQNWYDTPNFIQQIIHPDFKDYYLENFLQMQNGFVPKMLEYKILRKDGEERWWLQFNIGAYDIEQKLVSVSIVIIDNTETKDSFIKYQNLFENALVGMFRSSIETGAIIEANETMAKLFGCATVEELKQFSATQFYPSEKARLEFLSKLQKDGFVKGYQMKLQRKDKTSIWVTSSSKIYRREGFIEGVMTDITEQKLAQMELAKREKELENIFEHKGTATITIEEDMIVSKCNHQLEIMSGFTKEEIVGKKKWTEFVHPDDLPRLISYHQARRIKEDEAPTTYEARLLHKNGQAIEAFITVGLIPGSKQSIASLLDISQRKTAEKALIRDRKVLQIIAEAASQSLNVQDLCQSVLIGIVETIGFDSGSIRIYYENEKVLVPMADYGLDDKAKDFLKHVSIESTELPLTQFLGKSIFAPDTSEHEFLKNTDIITKFKYRSFISWPIYNANKKFLGSIQLGSRVKKDIPEADQLFFENITGIFSTAVERKLADEALIESESQYRKLVESMPGQMGVLLIQNKEIKYASPTIFKILQIKSIKDIIGADPLQYFSDANQEKIDNYLNSIYEFDDKEPSLYETVLRRTNNEEFPAEIYATLTTFRGDPAVQIIIWEITERREFERHRRQLENIIENSKEVVISADVKGNIIYANTPIEDVLGYTPDELIGKPLSILAPPGGEQLQEDMIKTTLAEGKTTIESVRKHKDGSLIPVIMTLTSITDEEAQLSTINAIIVDISDLKELEASLKGRSYELEVLNKIISAGYNAKNMDELLDFTLSTLLNSLDFNGGAIYFINDETKKAEIRRSLGLSNQFVTDAKELPIANKSFKKLFVDGKTIFVEDYMKMSEGHKGLGISTLIGVPFFSKQKVIGGLILSLKEKRTISKDDLSIFEAIGREMGTAIAKLRAEEEVISSEANLQTIFDAIEDFLIVFDSKSGAILNINKGVRKKLGYTKRELLKKKFTDLFPKDEAKTMENLLDKVVKGKLKEGPLILESKTGDKMVDTYVFYRAKYTDRTVIIARCN